MPARYVSMKKPRSSLKTFGSISNTPGRDVSEMFKARDDSKLLAVFTVQSLTTNN